MSVYYVKEIQEAQLSQLSPRDSRDALCQLKFYQLLYEYVKGKGKGWILIELYRHSKSRDQPCFTISEA